ncbi:helix-turn-helix transcriptional regulator [Pleurocapsales cyanobacterium LEGE 10410]|nr:helix-turn-helix transcriptional regulator [Pleurocapsales cyanobacterium LEGE 10410]
MKVYTETEYDRLYAESLEYEQLESNLRGFDEVTTAKSQWGEKKYYYAELSSGIELDIVDEQILLDRNRKIAHAKDPILIAKFYLSGYHGVICPGIDGIAPEYAETRGHNYLFCLPDIEEIEQTRAGDRLKLLRMEIDLAYIRNFATELNTVPQQLQALIENENPQRFHFNVGGITSQMQAIVQQISYHPYQGAIARMYLEAKVLELLSLQLAQLTESERDAVESTLKPKSIDRIYQARDILATQLENPPSISELTQQVGLCDRTLRRGFRELFGTTVIGYLTSLRMKQAEKLLRERKLSICEVANLVGYSNLSHFSAAFKRQFGITPSQCMTGKILNK